MTAFELLIQELTATGMVMWLKILILI